MQQGKSDLKIYFISMDGLGYVYKLHILNQLQAYQLQLQAFRSDLL